MEDDNYTHATVLVDEVAMRYTGPTRIQRLWFMVTHHNNNSAVITRALQLVCEQCVAQGNIGLAKHIVQQLPHWHHEQQQLVHQIVTPSWMAQHEQQYHQGVETVMTRLEHARAMLHKDAIREAHLAVARWHEQHGYVPKHDHHTNSVAAMQHYVRAKDYCVTQPQTVHVTLHIMQWALLLQQYGQAKDYAARLAATMRVMAEAKSSNNAALLRRQVSIAGALEKVARQQDLPAAAKMLAQVAMTPTTTPPGSHDDDQAVVLLADPDVSVYAALLTLAHHESRADVQALVDSADALEGLPRLKQALQHFGRCEYQACWHTLATHVFPAARLDVYLGATAAAATTAAMDTAGAGGSTSTTTLLASLQFSIQQKMMLAVWRPYRRLPLTALVEQLGPAAAVIAGKAAVSKDNLQELQSYWINLIRKGAAVHTRMDAVHGVLMRDDDHDDDSAAAVQLLQQRVVDDSYALLMRLACAEHDLVAADGDNVASSRRNQRRLLGASGTPGLMDLSSLEAPGTSSDDDDDNYRRRHGDDNDPEDTTMMMAMGDVNPEDLY